MPLFVHKTEAPGNTAIERSRPLSTVPIQIKYQRGLSSISFSTVTDVTTGEAGLT